MVARSPSTALEDAVGKIWNSSVPINHGNVSAIYFRTFIDSQDVSRLFSFDLSDFSNLICALCRDLQAKWLIEMCPVDGQSKGV